MKKILVIAIFLNTILSSKVIKVDDINGKKIESEQDFIDLIKDKNSAESSIRFIQDNIEKNTENTEQYGMPGFAVFIPDNNKINKTQIFIAMKHKVEENPQEDGNQQNITNCIRIHSKTLSFHNDAHTERQLCYTIFKYICNGYKLDHTNFNNGESVILNDIKNLHGTIYIFCKESPCFSGDKQTSISCFEYYSKLTDILTCILSKNTNIKIKIFFPQKNTRCRINSVLSTLQGIKDGIKCEDFINEYTKNYQLIHEPTCKKTIPIYCTKNYNTKSYDINLHYINLEIYKSYFFTKNTGIQKIKNQKQALENMNEKKNKIELIATNYDL